MTRKNIFEILESNYNVLLEFVAIDELFHSPLLFRCDFQSNGMPITIEDAVDKTCFYAWKQRGSWLQ